MNLKIDCADGTSERFINVATYFIRESRDLGSQLHIRLRSGEEVIRNYHDDRIVWVEEVRV